MAADVFCTRCGGTNHPEHQFCRKCGESLSLEPDDTAYKIETEAESSAKSRANLRYPPSLMAAYLLLTVLVSGFVHYRFPPRWPCNLRPRCQGNMRILEGAIDVWHIDRASAVFPDGDIAEPGGKPLESGAALVPDYLKRIPRCRQGGTYSYSSSSGTVHCSRHGTWDNYQHYTPSQ